MKLSPAKIAALEAVRDGKVNYFSSYLGSPWGGPRDVRSNTLYALRAGGLIVAGIFHREVALTDKGRALLADATKEAAA